MGQMIVAVCEIPAYSLLSLLHMLDTFVRVAYHVITNSQERARVVSNSSYPTNHKAH